MLRRITATLFALTHICQSASGDGVQADLLTVFHDPSVSIVHATYAPGDSQRLFASDLGGRVFVVRLPSGQVVPEPYLTVPAESGAKRGMYGAAFHPQYPSNGFVYVVFSRESHVQVLRFTRAAENPDRVDPASQQNVIAVPSGPAMHFGGWIEFGPDGYLYLSIGDGADSQSAQDLSGLRGKILRIDVDGDDFPADPERNYRIPSDNPFAGTGSRPEIWLYGLRNPWRCGFDPGSGALIIGDVGEHVREEITYVPPEFRGANLGWPCFEGTFPGVALPPCSPPNSVRFPLLEIGHTDAIPPTNQLADFLVGGPVYGGAALVEFGGWYFFLTNHSGQTREYALRIAAGQIAEFRDLTAGMFPPGWMIGNVVSFGRDASGELLLCVPFGPRSVSEIYRLVPQAPFEDCDGDREPDRWEIVYGGSMDENGDGLADECWPTEGDLDFDHDVDIQDLSMILAYYTARIGEPGYHRVADLDDDEQIALSDLTRLLSNFGTTP